MKKVIGNDYFELVRKSPLRQISNDRELDEATVVMDELTSREKRSSDADSYLDVLSDLVEKYEQQHHPRPYERQLMVPRVIPL